MIIQPIILAGGTGSRLWPLSRELYPKQLLSLFGDRSLLQSTYTRLTALQTAPPIIIVGEEHRFITKTQLEELSPEQNTPIILEPIGKNTAPAIFAGAYYSSRIHDDSVILLVLPADHLITQQDGFAKAVNKACTIAEKGQLVTFGIKPTSAETGYGYIESSDLTTVDSFVEKPDIDTANIYFKSGKHFWNSGMFAFESKTLLEQMELHCPQICKEMTNAVTLGKEDGDFYRLDKSSMEKCPNDSIDYALMEKATNVSVVPAEFGWSDIGSWKALWDVTDKDNNGNVLKGDTLVVDSSNCLIRAEHSLVASIGLENTMIVETADAVLVAPINRSQDVKKIVNKLKKEKRDEHQLHLTVFRPWGSYTILEEQENFKIKRITVLPGVKLSLQKHHHRSEHWVVVKGTAKVTCGDKEYLVLENQSSYIPCGEKHRLENPGVIPLELIEVQNGSYLGEDDIIRYDDDFGR